MSKILPISMIHNFVQSAQLGENAISLRYLTTVALYDQFHYSLCCFLRVIVLIVINSSSICKYI